MEPDGITRACTIVPVMKRNARITHSQETTSRTMTLLTAGFCSAVTTSVSSAFIRHHLNLNKWRFLVPGSARLQLGLRAVNGVHPGVARRAKCAARVTSRAAQACERKVPQRIGAEEAANFLDGALFPIILKCTRAHCAVKNL